MKYTVRSASVYFDYVFRLIGVPCGKSKKYGYADLDTYLVLEPNYDDYALEEFIFKILDMCFSKQCIDDGESVIQKYTGKKSYNVAVKGFNFFSFYWEKDVGYSITPFIKCKTYRGGFTPLNQEEIVVPINYEKGELAQAFHRAMEISSQDDYQPATVAPITQSITLLCEKEVSFVEPQDDHFIDAEDYNVAEIYQGYSYSEDDSKEPAAEFFFSIASELNCDISPDNIRNRWEHFYGKAETFNVMEANVIDTDVSIFTHRVEFRNKKTHKISYLIQLSEYEIFACELEIRLKYVDKALHFKLIKLFGEFARSVSLN